jgi:hypothetical protein
MLGRCGQFSSNTYSSFRPRNVRVLLNSKSTCRVFRMDDTEQGVWKPRPARILVSRWRVVDGNLFYSGDSQLTSTLFDLSSGIECGILNGKTPFYPDHGTLHELAFNQDFGDCTSTVPSSNDKDFPRNRGIPATVHFGTPPRERHTLTAQKSAHTRQLQHRHKNCAFLAFW